MSIDLNSLASRWRVIRLLAICLPGVCANPARAFAAPPPVDPVTGVIHSQRLAGGVPLGGVGAGTFSLMTDGAISQATLAGNWDRPTEDIPGCFAALRTNVAGHMEAHVLALHSAYGLPALERLDYLGLAPQAQIAYLDADLRVSASLLAFSPLTPFVISDSAYPAAAFVFRLRNPLPATVEVSIALSWESLLGIGSDGHGALLTDRTGVTAATIPSGQGYFGMRFASPAGAASASGDMALMAYPQLPQATVTTAGWNAMDARPGWWDGFVQTGDVAGSAPRGEERSVHPAGVVAIRLTLKPNEEVDLPFAVSWYLPHLKTAQSKDAGRFYQIMFADATGAAQRLLSDWNSLYALTQEWQDRLNFSNLPPSLIRRLTNAAATLTADTLLTRDGRFAFVFRPEAAHARLKAQALLLSFFPQLAARALQQEESPPSASVPPDPWQLPEDPVDLVLETAQYASWTGDRELTSALYPTVRGALQELLRDRDHDGLPAAKRSSGKVGELTLWLAALRAGRKLADGAQDRATASACAEAADRGAAALEAHFWNGRCYAPAAVSSPDGCDPEQLLGQWAAYQLGLGTLLPPDHLLQATRLLEQQTSALSDAALLATDIVSLWVGQADAGAHLLQHLGAQDLGDRQTPSPPTVIPERGALWNALYALAGFGFDSNAGTLSLQPDLLGAMRALTCPVYAPGFWATLEYKPFVHGELLTLRIDRLMERGGDPGPKGLKGSHVDLVLRSLRVPGPPARSNKTLPGAHEIHVSVGVKPIGFQPAWSPDGSLTLTFDTPLTLTTGDRLQVEVR